MNERYIKWCTPYLSRDFEMLVFGNGGGLPLILFPTSGARYYENRDFGLVGSVAWYIDNGKITVYCPDAIDRESLYNKSIHPADIQPMFNAFGIQNLGKPIRFVTGDIPFTGPNDDAHVIVFPRVGYIRQIFVRATARAHSCISLAPGFSRVVSKRIQRAVLTAFSASNLDKAVETAYCDGRAAAPA
jgi:hypothetical protein